MSNHHLRNTALSMKAKGLLSLMLSLPENWDYTLFGLSTVSTDGLSSIRATVGELEAAGYLRRRRIRNEKGQLTETEYTILEQPEPAVAHAEPPICENPTLGNPILGNPTLENHTQLNTYIQNKDKSNTDLSSIHQSIYPGTPQNEVSWGGVYPGEPADAQAQKTETDGIDAKDVYRELIMENIEYEFLMQRYGKERMDEILELILEIVLSWKKTIRISGADFPAEVVKSRFMKLGQFHVEYVFDCLDKNTTKVHNIKSYVLTTLYNAPSTIDSYYRAEVNHDLYGSP